MKQGVFGGFFFLYFFMFFSLFFFFSSSSCLFFFFFSSSSSSCFLFFFSSFCRFVSMDSFSFVFQCFVQVRVVFLILLVLSLLMVLKRYNMFLLSWLWCFVLILLCLFDCCFMLFPSSFLAWLLLFAGRIGLVWLAWRCCLYLSKDYAKSLVIWEGLW